MTTDHASSAAYTRFLPEGVPEWQMPFWDGLHAHRLTVLSCDQCGTLRHVPKEICSRCHSVDATWTDIDPGGEIYTFTVVHRAPTLAFQEDAPYVIAHVTMDAGPRMTGRLRVRDVESVAIGARVEARFNDATPEWTLLEFVVV